MKTAPSNLTGIISILKRHGLDFLIRLRIMCETKYNSDDIAEAPVYDRCKITQKIMWLRINRLRVEINTVDGLYGIDETFHSGLNFVTSLNNTCGKSSILAAIYYSLGFEQIIGGVGGIGNKVITSVFKTVIEDEGIFLTME